MGAITRSLNYALYFLWIFNLHCHSSHSFHSISVLDPNSLTPLLCILTGKSSQPPPSFTQRVGSVPGHYHSDISPSSSCFPGHSANASQWVGGTSTLQSANFLLFWSYPLIEWVTSVLQDHFPTIIRVFLLIFKVVPGESSHNHQVV